MLAALRSRSPSLSSAALSTSSVLANRSWNLGFCTSNQTSSSSPSADTADKLLNLQDIEKVLHDTKADNVSVIPAAGKCHWLDYMVIATGRSEQHVKSIAEALVYKAKKKQKGDEEEQLCDELEQLSHELKQLSDEEEQHGDEQEQKRAMAKKKKMLKARIEKLNAEKQRQNAKRLVLPHVVGKKEGKWVVIDSGRVIVHALDEKAREYYNLDDLWKGRTTWNEPTEEFKKAFTKVRRINNSKRRPQAQRRSL